MNNGNWSPCGCRSRALMLDYTCPAQEEQSDCGCPFNDCLSLRAQSLCIDFICPPQEEASDCGCPFDDCLSRRARALRIDTRCPAREEDRCGCGCGCSHHNDCSFRHTGCLAMCRASWNPCCRPLPPCPPCPPIPPMPTIFSFTKRNSVTLAPLTGATFTLYRDGAVAGTATSDFAGLVSFGNVAPGHYTMVETITPPGYMPNTTPRNVFVTPFGHAFVDGLPVDQFVADNVPLVMG